MSGDGVVEVVESGGREPCRCQCVKALERSLKQREKWEVKMNGKMMIFAKARVGFDFSKIIHFQFILKSIFQK